MKKFYGTIAAVMAMLILILDGKTALAGAHSGLELCFKSVIPSLFPFIVVSQLLNSGLTGLRIPALQLPGRLCGVPRRAEGLLLLGLFGGYPVGAQSINEACKNGAISKTDARRLLGFCNNAGPAFIFGMGGVLFSEANALWALWILHIFSALAVGFTLPGKRDSVTNIQHKSQLTLTQAVEKGIRTMAVICGWVILFRIVLAFCSRWFFWFLPESAKVFAAGLLELTNGMHSLQQLPGQGVRFLFAACFLSFGGVCVAMQTISVTKDVGLGMYFPGKLLQSVLSFIGAYYLQFLLFEKSDCVHIQGPIMLIISVILVILLSAGKISVAFRKKVLYNGTE